ncbi:MAG: hypothetical protein MJ244_03770 [Clostridia bacterium]|nr:hypothetical protein [Clostridia bacterium]
MDLILITMVTVTPFLIGSIIEEEKNSKKGVSTKSTRKALKDEGYVVCKYGNFDYAYKRV